MKYSLITLSLLFIFKLSSGQPPSDNFILSAPGRTTAIVVGKNEKEVVTTAAVCWRGASRRLQPDVPWSPLSLTACMVYTIGMRGIHDSRMQGARTLPQEAAVLSKVFKDQRGLLTAYVNQDVTRVPQVFMPYKEVLPVYDYGLKMPDDVTLMWPDDNYGYIRRLSRTPTRNTAFHPFLDGDQIAGRIRAYHELIARVERIKRQVPADRLDAYFELVT